jgi:hypothetical protein
MAMSWTTIVAIITVVTLIVPGSGMAVLKLSA